MNATIEAYSKIYLGGGGQTVRKGRRPGEGLGASNAEQLELEKRVSDIYKEAGVYNWTWATGGL